MNRIAAASCLAAIVVAACNRSASTRTARCGPLSCDVTTSYCEIFLSDVPEIPTNYFCRPLPLSCVPEGSAARTCDCFPADTRCRAFCGPLPTTSGALQGFHLTCQGRRPPSE